MKAYLTWNDENLGAQGFNVYRDTQPLDPQNLPVPLASLGPEARDYEDATVVDQTTYYYMVTALVDGQEPATANFEILAEEVSEVPTYEVFDATGTGATGTVQTWEAPNTGLFTVEAFGAQGGGLHGGLGARIKGTFSLVAGDILEVYVGHQGETVDVAAGGGGGSFVVRPGAATASDVLVIAGGGGGSALDFSTERDGFAGEDGRNGFRSGGGGKGLGGTNGDGGGAGYRTGGGAGFTGAGEDSSESPGGRGGAAFLEGGAGGGGRAPGGFGGGGGAEGTSDSWDYNGGGGGYSGGGAAGGDATQTAGGGGSYNAGDDQVNESGVREGHGQVLIYNAPGLAAQA